MVKNYRNIHIIMKQHIIPAIIVALGLAVAGLFVWMGVHQLATKDRAVTVKGLATKDVKADRAIWPISYTIDGNNISTLYTEASKMEEILRKELTEKGFSLDDIRRGNTSVSDNWANYYGNTRPANQYSLSTSIVVTTSNVDLVIASQTLTNDLLVKGIIIHSYDWSLDYQFTGLTEIKPMMIEEATKNARTVAQKFADDANCRLGSIRHANQGQFSIESDQYEPWIKHVRVVTTIDYYLK